MDSKSTDQRGSNFFHSLTLPGTTVMQKNRWYKILKFTLFAHTILQMTKIFRIFYRKQLLSAHANCGNRGQRANWKCIGP